MVASLHKAWSMADEPEEVLLYATDLIGDGIPDEEETHMFIDAIRECADAMQEFSKGVTCDGHP